MKTRRFGRAGFQVSEIVFGGGWVGGLLIHGSDDDKTAALKLAFDSGVNWVDTAPSYGNGRSEEVLGELLGDFEQQPHLSSKARLDLSTGGTDFVGEMARSLESSLETLGRDSVDLFFLHNPIAQKTGDGAIGLEELLRPGGAADGLEAMRDRGLARSIGITALGEGPACRTAVESDRFDVAQVYYNILNPSAGRSMPGAWTGHDFSGLMAACKARDVGVMAIRVYAGGALASDKPHGREIPVTDDGGLAVEQARAAAVVEALALGSDDGRRKHGTPAQTALRYVLANQDVSCAVVGLAELSHLREALGAAEMGPLSEEGLAKLDSVYDANFGLGRSGA